MWVLLRSQSLTADTASVTFRDIPYGFDDLQIVARARSDNASVGERFSIQVGSGTVDSGANYSSGGITSGDTAGGTNFETNDVTSLQESSGGSFTGNNADAGARGFLELTIWNYTNIDEGRVFTWTGGYRGSSTVYRNMQASGIWRNLADPIDIITISPALGANWKSDSFFNLYGRYRDGVKG